MYITTDLGEQVMREIDAAFRMTKVQAIDLAPPGGFYGQLPQRYVAFDADELAVADIPLSGLSLITNLNRIRAGASLGSGIIHVTHLGTDVLDLIGSGGGGGPLALDDLTDVIITDPLETEVLKFDGVNWVNGTVSGSGGTSGVGATDRITYWQNATTLTSNADFKFITASGHKMAVVGAPDFNEVGAAGTKVGITIVRDGTDGGLLMETYSSSFSPNIAGLRARGTRTATSNTLANDVLIRLAGRGYIDTDWADNSALRIDGIATENTTSTNRGSKFAFYVTASGADISAQRMELDSNALKVINGATIAIYKNGSSTINGSFDPSTLTVARSYILPDNDGTLALTSDITGGTPGGADTQVQFNDGGVFGGDANFTFDKTSRVLTITDTVLGTLAINGTHINGDAGNGIVLAGGNGAGATAGGPIQVTAGNSGSGTAGSISFSAGDSSGVAGNVTFFGGDGASSGNIAFIPGTNGQVMFRRNTPAIYGIFDFNSLASSNKTFTFPNATGTVALTADLAAYVPYVGATTDVTLGSHNLGLTGYVDFTAIANPASPAAGVVRLHALTTQGFSRLEQDNEATTNVTLGRDTVYIAKNTSGSTINKGQVVYITGSTGNVPNIALAKADVSTTLPATGIVLDNISNNAFGQVMLIGVIANFDTSAFTAGDAVYVSATTAGALTNVRPVSPNIAQRVGSVMVSGVGNGSLVISIAPFMGGVDTGTIASTWRIGPGSGAGAVAITFNNANVGTLTWTPSTSRTITLPDATGTVALTSQLASYQPVNTTLTTLAALADATGWLHNDGAGVLAWTTPPGSGTPGGANTQIQYNNSGAFGGSANLTFDGASVVTLHNPSVVDGSGSQLEVSANDSKLLLSSYYHSGGGSNEGNFVYGYNAEMRIGTMTNDDVIFVRNGASYLSLTAGVMTINATEIDFYNSGAGVYGQLSFAATGSTKSVTIPNYTGYVALGAGTLTVSTTNNATSTATHTHAITSSSNPGAAASILATDSSGNLKITGTFEADGLVGLGTAPVAHQALNVAITDSNAGGNVHGVIGVATVNNTTTGARGLYGQTATTAAGFTLGEAVSILAADASKGAGSTITTAIGLKVNNITAGTTNYAIYTGTGIVDFNDTTDSSSTTTGSVQTAGGMGIAKMLNVGTQLGVGAAAMTDRAIRAAISIASGSGYGIVFSCYATAAATATEGLYIATGTTTAASYTLGSAVGVHVTNPNKAAGTTITTAYGIQIDSITNGSTNYSIFTGAGIAYFGGGVRVAADGGGAASTTSFTNATNTTVTNTYIVRGGQAANTVNTGWIKIFVGTAAAWIPYWQNATP